MNGTKKEKDLDRLLIEAIQNGYSVYAWKTFNGVIEKCEMKIKAMRKEMNELELEISVGETKKIADIVSGNKEFSFYLPESSLSFEAKMKVALDDKKVKVHLPTEFTFFERRKHERLSPRKTCFFTFENGRTSMKVPVSDMSLGGVAIILPKTDKVMMKKGQLLQNCFLEILGRKMKIEVECASTVSIDRYKFDHLPYGGHKLSFRFTTLSKEDKVFLTDFIANEVILLKGLKGA
jgi:c-di-GMP-binding flagellar brake protein YcgR